MDKEHHKRLKKLNVDKSEKFLKKNTKKENWFTKHPDFLPIIRDCATAATVGPAALGAIMALAGCDYRTAWTAGSAIAMGVSFPAAIKCAFDGGAAAIDKSMYRNPDDVNPDDVEEGVFVALLAAGLAGVIASMFIGGNIGMKAHKLTTSVIDKLKPQHQIERTIETEPMPEINEIQV